MHKNREIEYTASVLVMKETSSQKYILEVAEMHLRVFSFWQERRYVFELRGGEVANTICRVTLLPARIKVLRV